MVLLLVLALGASACRAPEGRDGPGPTASPSETGEDEGSDRAEDVEPPPVADPNLTGRVGLIVVSNSRTFPRLLGSPSEPGVVVLWVQPDGPSSGANLQRGDVITHVNGDPSVNAELAVRQLRARPGDERRLRVLPAGGGAARQVTVTAQNPGNIDVRKDYYQEMVRETPDDPIVHYLRAQSTGPFDENIESAERAADLFPGFTEAISLRAELLFNQSQHRELPVEKVDEFRDRAQRDWRIALNQEPTNTRVLVSFAQALAQLGSVRLAHQHATRAVELDETFPGAHYAVALAEYTRSRYAAAARPARRAVDLNPYDVRYYRTLAFTFAKLDRDADARRTADAISGLLEPRQRQELYDQLKNV